MELYYLSSTGVKLDFTKWPYLVLNHNLYDSGWSYTTKNGGVVEFDKDVQEKTLVLNISADNKSEYYGAVNQLASIIDRDTLNNQPGRLYVENQYILCNMCASLKEDWQKGVDYLKNTLTIVLRYPYWITEQKFSFLQNGKAAYNQPLLDYPHDYPYDYAVDGAQNYISNDSYSSADFELIVYGPCTNPRISISGHIYEVITSVNTDEYLQIRSREGTIYKVSESGEKTNLYNYRNKDSSVFERIPPGSNPVSWDGNFGFDITLYVERSEPKWIL